MVETFGCQNRWASSYVISNTTQSVWFHYLQHLHSPSPRLGSPRAHNNAITSMNPALGMNVCLLPCVISCDCLALHPLPKESTARLKYDSDNMSDRDDQSLNEGVAELTEDVLHRAGRLSKGPCRLSWKASATKKTEG